MFLKLLWYFDQIDFVIIQTMSFERIIYSNKFAGYLLMSNSTTIGK